jgi:hypothetical protein
VDKKPFRDLLRYLRPSLTEKDIPHRTKIRKEVLKRAATAEDRVRDRLAVIPSKVSFTFDSWTSDAGDPYLSVTGHYIFAPADKPQEWKLKAEQLAFKHIKGNHSGANISKILVNTLDRYKLRKKVEFPQNN